jgi:hypothetical protein
LRLNSSHSRRYSAPHPIEQICDHRSVNAQ